MQRANWRERIAGACFIRALRAGVCERALKYKDKSNVSQVAREYGYAGRSEWGEAASGLQNVIGTAPSIINR